MKLDGQVPENANVVLACGDPAGALTAFVIVSVAGAGGPAGATVRLATAWRLVRPPVPAPNPRNALAGSETACESTCVPSTATLSGPVGRS